MCFSNCIHRSASVPDLRLGGDALPNRLACIGQVLRRVPLTTELLVEQLAGQDEAELEPAKKTVRGVRNTRRRSVMGGGVMGMGGGCGGISSGVCEWWRVFWSCHSAVLLLL